MPSSTPAGRRKVSWRRKLAGLALGSVLSLVCLELTLWTLHAIYAPPSRVPELAPAPGERRILCMGDSNTYGVYLEPEESYPGRLQTYLDEAPGNPWRVFNLGYPGQNTAQMRGRLARNLEVYQPEILVLLGGINNSWSPAMSYLWDHPDDEPAERSDPLLDRSRALGALRMMFLEGRRVTVESDGRRYEKRMSRDGDFAVPGLDGAARGEGLGDVESVDSSKENVRFGAEAVRHGISTDLRRIHAICEEHGVSLVLAQYWVDLPWIDPRINAPIGDFAQATDLPLAPTCERIRELVGKYGRDLVLFKDEHARISGNREVARQVLLTLMDSGLLERRPEWEAVPDLEAILGQPLALEISARKDTLLELRLTGPARMAYTLTLDEIVLRDDEYEFVAQSEVERLTGRLSRRDATFRRLTLPAPGFDESVGWRVTLGPLSGEGPTSHVNVPR